jgi:putative ABC transport system ATP-binding protein
MSAPIVEAEAATLRYWDHDREVFACRAIDLAVSPGEFLGILGPSGSGKSSLLYLLSGLKLPTSGQVRLDGQNLTEMTDEMRSRIRLHEFGFVFQQPYLLGYLSGLENVLVAQRGSARLGVGDKAHRFPHELSGGERQRVCVARALLGTPKVVFADEPTASLDHTNGLAVVELLHQHRGGGSVVMVTHDRSMLQPADRVVIIEDGRIQSDAA